MIPPICPYCNRVAKKVSGETIYPHRPDLHHLTFYECAPCCAYVGTHRTSGKPLGTLANAELRKLRWETHQAFDTRWQGSRSTTRQSAYKWLSRKMKIDMWDCHIGQFDKLQCKIAIKICQEAA